MKHAANRPPKVAGRCSPSTDRPAMRRWIAVQAMLFVVAFVAFCPLVALGNSGHGAGLGATALAVQIGRLPSEQIRKSANRVMQQHDYRSVRRRVLENVPYDTDVDKGFLQQSLRTIGNAVGDFFEWLLSGLFSSGGGGGRRAPAPTPSPAPVSSGSGMDFSLGKVLLYIGLAILISVTIWIIANVLKTSDGNRKLNRDGLFGEEGLSDLSVPPGELAASTYESRALQMAKVGDYCGAIRELLIGSMSWIERAGMIRYRKGLTNRDYVRAVWREEGRRAAYGATALEFERIYFGRREATREMFQDCLQSFQGSFREEETTTAKV
ncbi:MAG: DUF4129 domain-containing protein [Fuerstiella sp.]